MDFTIYSCHSFAEYPYAGISIRNAGATIDGLYCFGRSIYDKNPKTLMIRMSINVIFSFFKKNSVKRTTIGIYNKNVIYVSILQKCNIMSKDYLYF